MIVSSWCLWWSWY